MRKPGRIGLVTLLGVASILLPACQSGDLVKRHSSAGLNGGFEVTEAGVPVNWAFFPYPESDRTLQVVSDSEQVLEGSRSLNVVVRPGEKLPGFRSSQIPVQPGRNYRLSISLKNDGCSLRVNRIVQDASGKTALRRDIIIDTSTSSTQWETFEETLTVRPDEAQVLLVFLIDGSGQVWFDDVKLEGLAQ
jgi:hypothetical protein